MNKVARKFSVARSILKDRGISGIYETFMYRYFWPIAMRFSRNSAKHWEEIRYWKRQAKRGPLNNSWYENIFTEPFGLDVSSYADKNILDIGCGPRGSLEWAHDAAERVGLDPLISKYRDLGIESHEMQYVEARSENIPFADNYFDIVSCINALDHVDNVEQTLEEIVRVLRPGGHFLLMVDVGHEPTLSEPHTLSWDVLDSISSRCETERFKRYKQDGGATQSVTNGVEICETESDGVLLAMVKKL
jgi:SAM-dependent methyltransferase